MGTTTKRRFAQVAALWAATWSAFLAPVSAATQESLLGEVRSVFLAEERDSRSLGDVLTQLGGLGPDAALIFFELFYGGPSLEELYQVEGVEPQNVRWWGAPDQYGEIAASVLVEQMPEEAERVLAPRSPKASLDERLGRLHLTARLGTEASFTHWLETVGAFSEHEIEAHLVRVTLRKSLASHLAARPEAYQQLEAMLAGPCDRIFLDELVRAVQLDGHPLGIRILVGLLERERDGLEAPAPHEVIPELDHLARRYPWVLGSAWQERLQVYVRDPRPLVRLVSTAALEGRPEAFELLLSIAENVAAPHQGAIAQQALAGSFGLKIKLPANAWEYRIQRELSWWNGTGSEQVDALLEADVSRSGVLFRGLAQREAFRGKIAASVAARLREMDEEVALGAVAFLLELGDPAAVPGLVDALDRLPGAEESLLLALEGLTGRSFGREARAWRRALAL